MPRSRTEFLGDIISAIEKIQKYTNKKTYADFLEDSMLLDAVIRNLEIIGEAVKTIPDPVRAKAPEIKWRQIAGLRDILLHGYFRVDEEIVWDIIQNELDFLGQKIQELLQDMNGEPSTS